jgi:hypothetical protein
MVLNEYGKIPTIRFDEEDIIISTDNKRIVNRLGSCITYAFSPLEAENEFDLINPLTDQPLGATAKYQDLYVLLYSIYYHMAELRDRGTRPYPSWTWDEVNGCWAAPIPKPDLENEYVWNEATLSWDLVVPPE